MRWFFTIILYSHTRHRQNTERKKTRKTAVSRARECKFNKSEILSWLFACQSKKPSRPSCQSELRFQDRAALQSHTVASRERGRGARTWPYFTYSLAYSIYAAACRMHAIRSLTSHMNMNMQRRSALRLKSAALLHSSHFSSCRANARVCVPSLRKRA